MTQAHLCWLDPQFRIHPTETCESQMCCFKGENIAMIQHDSPYDEA